MTAIVEKKVKKSGLKDKKKSKAVAEVEATVSSPAVETDKPKKKKKKTSEDVDVAMKKEPSDTDSTAPSADSNAMEVDEIEEALPQSAVRGRNYKCVQCSAKTGEGLQEGISMLLENIKAKSE